MLGKGGISVSQTSIFLVPFRSQIFSAIFLKNFDEIFMCYVGGGFTNTWEHT